MKNLWFLRDSENSWTSELYRENKRIETFVYIPSWPAFANFYKFHLKEDVMYKVQCRLCFLPKIISTNVLANANLKKHVKICISPLLSFQLCLGFWVSVI